MFVTAPGFEELIPKEIGGDEARYWTAVMLSAETPWFLVTFWQKEHELAWTQTVAVAWETTLLSVFESATAKEVFSISRLARDHAPEGPWLLREVAELWIPLESEANETGPLLFRVVGGSSLRDTFGGEVPESQEGRRLLFRRSC